MKNKFKKFILLAFASIFFISLASCGEETHNYGELHQRVEPSFFNDGNISYYECSHCHKYFDLNKKEVDSVLLSKYSKDISLEVNYEYVGDFTLVEENDNHIIWEYTNIDLNRDDSVRVVDKAKPKTERKYEANTSSNITERGSVYNNVENGTITLEATPNGLYLSVSGDKTLTVKYNYKSTMTDMIQNESNPNIYEIKNVRLMEGDLFNIYFVNRYYFTFGRVANANFKTWMEDGITYLKCYVSGIYNVSFDINGRDVIVELVEEIPHYSYYFHTFNSSGSNYTMREVEDSNEVWIHDCWLKTDAYYYVLKANDKNTEDNYPYGELDSASQSLGVSVDFDVTKMFTVNKNGYYDIYFNTETNEIRLVLIEE